MSVDAETLPGNWRVGAPIKMLEEEPGVKPELSPVTNGGKEAAVVIADPAEAATVIAIKFFRDRDPVGRGLGEIDLHAGLDINTIIHVIGIVGGIVFQFEAIHVERIVASGGQEGKEAVGMA